MNMNELIATIESLNEWEQLLSEAKEQVESLKDELKGIMTEQGTEELIAGQYVVRYTTVSANRFDSTSFKKAMPELYKSYIKLSTSRRFTVSW